VKETEATLTDKEDSDSDDDNIPVSQILAMKTSKKTQVPMLQTGEACIGHMILKKFETGLFKGTVTSATKQRGRFMYHVLYDDGDSEDMNDKELLEGHDMYNRQTETTFQTSTSFESDEDAASDHEKSGIETEGSDYQDSYVEEQNKRNKKRKLAGGKPKVQLKSRSKKTKEKKETPKRTRKPAVIDVEAILLSGAKNSVTTKTIEALTPEEKKELMGNAGKSLLTQAKKGMRVQAMTVREFYLSAYILSSNLFIAPCIEKIFYRCQRCANKTSSCDEGTCS
jgi:hypothetical protein